MIFQANLSLARAAAEKIDAAVLAIHDLSDKEPKERSSGPYPTANPRLVELRRISRELAKLETALDALYQ